MTKESSIFNAQVYVCSDSVLCLGKIHENPESNEACKKKVEWITSSQSYRDNDGISEEPTEFEWNIFQGFDTVQLCDKVKDLLSRLGETVKSISPKTENSMQYGYDENDDNNMSNEIKREINYSMNNKWNNNTRNMHIT